MTLQRVLELLANRDRDLYGLLALSLVLAIVELLSGAWATALFAGTLFGFSLSMIQIRRDLSLISADRIGAGGLFQDTTPPDLAESLASAQDLLLIGVSLDRTIRNAYTQLEECLRRGSRLRVLLVNPDNAWAVKTAEKRAYPEQGEARRREHILSSIESFRQLREATDGNVELRITDDPLTFGGTLIDSVERTKKTRIVVQHYSYKKKQVTEPNPVFSLRPSDGRWYDGFREEMENLWESATPRSWSESGPNA